MNKTDQLLQPKNLDFLRACFDTTQIDQGYLFWNERPRHHFKSSRNHTTFNNRYAGTIVGKTPCLKMPHILVGVRHPDLGPIRVMLHRLIWLLKYEEAPPKLIDHINRIPFDNRPSNLRAATQKENLTNCITNSGCISSGEVKEIGDGRYKTVFVPDQGLAPMVFEFDSRLMANTALNYLSFLFDARYAEIEGRG